jgi:hypothetical protein
MKNLIYTIVYSVSILILHAESKSEIDVILSRIDQAQIDPEFSEGFKNIVKEPEPRIVELMRRIEVEYYSKSLGTFSSEIGKTNNDFLYPQIDGVLLDEEADGQDGIIAARVIQFYKRSAIRVVYWNRPEDEQGIIKRMWKRKFPEGIDITMPLDRWDDAISSQADSTKECERLYPLFDDPMPPSTLNITAHQMAGDLHYIIEMVARKDGKLKYHWAIRSPTYAGLIEAISFEEIWKGISETPNE